tara:strand:+ start:827 stop:1063 length:237 start_codon:yes stop_codon:yes gene_type:complete
MKTKDNIEEYRNNITMHLTRMSGDLEHIKEKVIDNNKHLIRLNGRVRETEKQISGIKGIGSTIVFVVGIVLTWLGIQK